MYERAIKSMYCNINEMLDPINIVFQPMKAGSMIDSVGMPVLPVVLGFRLSFDLLLHLIRPPPDLPLQSDPLPANDLSLVLTEDTLFGQGRLFCHPSGIDLSDYHRLLHGLTLVSC